MTDYTELVKALRETATFTKFDDLLSKREQKLESLAFDAAAAIEELQQIADHYEQTAKDYWKEACEYKAQLPKRGQYVHGRELSREYIGDCLVSIDYEDWRCSVCGIVFEQWSMPTYNYCPNCGAKMEVQDDKA